MDLLAGNTTRSGSGRIVLSQLFGKFDASAHGEFVPFAPGVRILPLYGRHPDGGVIDASGPSAALLRYEPGASIPKHRHRSYEHIFVLEGSQQDELGVHPPGTCVISPPGSQHRVASPEGCLVLAIWNQAVEMLE